MCTKHNISNLAHKTGQAIQVNTGVFDSFLEHLMNYTVGYNSRTSSVCFTEDPWLETHFFTFLNASICPQGKKCTSGARLRTKCGKKWNCSQCLKALALYGIYLATCQPEVQVEYATHHFCNQNRLTPINGTITIS